LIDGGPAVKPVEDKMLVFGFIFLTSTILTILYFT